MRRLFVAFLTIAACSTLAPAQGQQVGSVADDVLNGHHLAIVMCSSCHVVGPDQLIGPILQPPAPSFDSVAQRRTTSAATIQAFLATTHRDISKAAGMPNPELADFQIRQLAAFMLSLRSTPAAAERIAPSAAPPGSCHAEIAHLESLLRQTNRGPIGSAPESSAARLHRQPTLQSVEQAGRQAEKNVETTLAFARRLEAEGLDAECAAMLQRVELSLGLPGPGY